MRISQLIEDCCKVPFVSQGPNLKSGGLYFYKVFSIKNNWDGFPIFTQDDLPHEMRQNLDL